MQIETGKVVKQYIIASYQAVDCVIRRLCILIFSAERYTQLKLNVRTPKQ